jgi:hypothetical protein
MMDALTKFLTPYVTLFPLGNWVLTIVALAWGIYVWRRDNRQV